MKLPTGLVTTRWNSWFNAAKYLSSFTKFYEGIFKQEKSYDLAVDRILELVDDGWQHHTSYYYLCLNLHFINENCTHLITVLTSLEVTKSQFACMMEDVKQYLHTGTSKSTLV